MQKQENFFRGSPEHFLDKNDIWDRTPPTYTSIAVYMCGGVQGSQIFKQNSIISIRSKVMAFLVISLSPWSPHCLHIIPVIPTSSLCFPHHPHLIPIAPRRSPCGPHGCGLRCLRGLHPMLSPWSPCCPRCPHVIPIVPMSSPYRPHYPHIVPIAPEGPHVVPMPVVSVVSMVSTPCCPHGPHVVPVVPTSSPCCPRHPHIV